MFLGMKRARGDAEIDSFTMANYLLLLSQDRQTFDSVQTQYPSSDRVFECKTCNKKFQSFQALGGHRASHKKPRLVESVEGKSDQTTVPMKQRRHECSICGVEFALGQALGGHMRRHRLTINSNVKDYKTALPVKNLPSPDKTRALQVTKESNGGNRFLRMDLNLTPTENDIRSFNLIKFG